jgi:hypothetical protein
MGGQVPSLPAATSLHSAATAATLSISPGISGIFHFAICNLQSAICNFRTAARRLPLRSGWRRRADTTLDTAQRGKAISAST